jgi:dGTPase
MSDKVLEATDKLRNYLYQEVYTDKRIRSQAMKAERVVQELYSYFLDNPKMVLEEYSYIMNKFEKERLICDFISSLSDREALSLYKELFLPKSWRLR